ncbi:hypothetical protein DFH27DRAFT_644878 [Peziza echinospora]|nr:hypothetical protein DFH27DRAFT_644878 [Peziza echinospora]
MAFNFPPFTLTISVPFNYYNDLVQHIDFLHQTLFSFSNLNKQILKDNEDLRRELSAFQGRGNKVTLSKSISEKFEEPMVLGGVPVPQLRPSKRTSNPLATIQDGAAVDLEQRAMPDPVKFDPKPKWVKKQWQKPLHRRQQASWVQRSIALPEGSSSKSSESLEIIGALATSSAEEGDDVVLEDDKGAEVQHHEGDKDQTYDIHASFDQIMTLSNKIRSLTRGGNSGDEIF